LKVFAKRFFGAFAGEIDGKIKTQAQDRQQEKTRQVESTPQKERIADSPTACNKNTR
jgi:hypothetical protein